MGAKKGHIVSELTKRKIGLSNTGKHRSIETRKRQSSVAKKRLKNPRNHPMYGKHQSKVWIDKRRKTVIDNGIQKGENNGFYGKHHTTYSRDKMSESGKKKVFTIKHRENLSKASAGENNPMFDIHLCGKDNKNYGSHRSKETKRKQRESAIKRIERCCNNGEPIHPCVGKQEKPILDELEKQHGCKFIKQYYIDGYWLDGYSKELNLAVEVDEPYHNRPKQKKHDMEKEEYIKDKLKCKFIRISVK